MKKIIDFIRQNLIDFAVVLAGFFLLKIPYLSNISLFLNGYVVASLIWFALIRPKMDKRQFNLHRSYFYLFYSITLFGFFLAKIIVREIGLYASPFFIPITLLVLLFDVEIAIVTSIFFAIIFSLVFNLDALGFAFILTNSLLTALLGSRIQKRMHVARSALFVALFSMIFYLFHIELHRVDINLMESLVILFIPIVFSIVSIGVLPFIEYASMIYSNVDLMELSNLNNSLLKLLSLRAPGTYYHSSMVANLAEAAAQRIGANAILARTAAYFHDIGKSKRPYFYTENIYEKNPHDELNPKLSHLIIQDHVKSGIEMAKRNRLPLLIQDVIPQHHGTRVQKYFYHKSKDMGEELSENEFRYSGPKPQFKEAGIIMLADAVEAAARSMKNPTAGRIKTMVEEVISGIYNERELDESGLTLKDLEAIAEEFTKVLFSMFRSRIEYPKEEIKKVINLAEDSLGQQNENEDRSKKDQASY